MVMHYLHVPPSDDVEAFYRQVSMAVWIERRLNPPQE